MDDVETQVDEHWCVTPDILRWKTSANPTSAGHVHRERTDGVLVGTASVTPRPVTLCGERIIAAEIGDTHTHPRYRRRGVFSSCVRACTAHCLSSGINLIYGEPNSQSLPGYRDKLGYPVAANARVRYYANFLNTREVARQAAKRLPRKLRVLAPVLAGPWWLATHRVRRPADPPAAGITIREIGEFPKDIDPLWGLDRMRWAFFGLRGTDYLNWRYFGHPHQYFVLGAFIGPMLVGYLATKISTKEGVTECALVDYIAMNDATPVLHTLLRDLEPRLQAWGVDVVKLYCAESSPYNETFHTHGFKSLSDVPVIVFGGTPMGRHLLLSKAAWHFTMGDTDHR